MRIALLTASASRLAGGLFESVRSLARPLHGRSDVDLEVFAPADPSTAADRGAWLPVKVTTPACAAGLSRELDIVLADRDVDLLHVHGLTTLPSVVCRRWADATGRPYIITPHGALGSRRRGLAGVGALVADLLYRRAHLAGAGCLHASTEDEAVRIRALGIKVPVCVVPAGVEAPDEAISRLLRPAQDVVGSRRVLLHVAEEAGRFPELLLQAWQAAWRIGGPVLADWQLVLAGYDRRTIDQIESWCATHAATERVRVFQRPARRQRQVLYRAAAAYVLPTAGDATPIDVLEAWTHGLPVILAQDSSLRAGIEDGAALQAASTAPALARAIVELTRMSDAERSTMGQRGRALVDRRHTSQAAADAIAQVYAWLLGGGPAPACVDVR